MEKLTDLLIWETLEKNKAKSLVKERLLNLTQINMQYNVIDFDDVVNEPHGLNVIDFPLLLARS